ncbi:hypothetical protein BJ684DRAFT_15889 [Piptocephalis cylindrospora]|uniref:Uncharacterized protein n=1 Tax=Piptocephalis cylindrospora TaxID=1907219 RepID=A0A4P9Y442_9FUNG|nr:hypothetical protein BJ684DRAFT_15889 [Piptocephalis cylindrospora]|eukprot:RKP13738.1 hypothetical protein BJ684DRAFT_15889 [Piptocephalis cylindrospora]
MSRDTAYPIVEEDEEEGYLSDSPDPSFMTAPSFSSPSRSKPSEPTQREPPSSLPSPHQGHPVYTPLATFPTPVLSHPPPRVQRRTGPWSWLRYGRSSPQRSPQERGEEEVILRHPTYPQDPISRHDPQGPFIPQYPMSMPTSPPMPAALLSSLSSATLVSSHVPSQTEAQPHSPPPRRSSHPAGVSLSWSASQPLPSHSSPPHAHDLSVSTQTFHSFPSRNGESVERIRLRDRRAHQSLSQIYPPLSHAYTSLPTAHPPFPQAHSPPLHAHTSPSPSQTHPPFRSSQSPPRTMEDGSMSAKEARQWYRKRLRGSTHRIYWCLEDPIRPPTVPIPPQVGRVLSPRDLQMLQRKYIREEEGRRREWIQKGLTQPRWTQLQYRYWRAHHPRLPQPCRPLPYRAIQDCPPGWTIYYFPDAILLEPTGTSLASRVRRSGPFREERFLCDACGLTSDTPGWMKLHALTRRDMYPLHPVVHPRTSWVLRGLVCAGVLRMREKLEEAWKIQQASSLREKRRRKEKQGRRRHIERPEERRRRSEAVPKIEELQDTLPSAEPSPSTTYSSLLRGTLAHWGLLRG